MALKIEVERSGEESPSVCVRLQGELDIHTSHLLKKQFKPLLKVDNCCVEIDLAKVDAIDSAGIATLAEGLEWSRNTGHRFVLSGLSQQVMDALALAKLAAAFEIETEEATR